MRKRIPIGCDPTGFAFNLNSATDVVPLNSCFGLCGRVSAERAVPLLKHTGFSVARLLAGLMLSMG